MLILNFLFIGFRESIIVATVIPLSLLVSIIIMHFYGLTFNELTLMGFIIALGMLVDNAIVVMENIDRLRDEGLSKLDAAKAGINQIAPAVLAATLTTVVAFIPLANLSGAMGQMIKHLPLTIIFVLVSSLFISLAITPVLSSRFLSKYKISERERKK
ncbi:efflux RND transporter permease subunit [Clostridiaceae bacterium HSG29]|nr:efflux RND transporter permease subunit [Clostridiaceae bacterium HSG29]